VTTAPPTTSAQRAAARAAGLCYLVALPLAVFAELYAFGSLVARGDVAQTARNVAGHATLFRWGIASNLCVFALDVVLITSLYVVLERVHRPLALLAALWRLVETALLVATTVFDLGALRLVQSESVPGDAGRGLAAALAAHGDAYGVALVFAGLGTAVFCGLWFASRLMPRALAAFGVFAGLVLAGSMLALIVAPALHAVVTLPMYGGPIFVFELFAGLWLALRGLPAETAVAR
jgi:hypothetical protein